VAQSHTPCNRCVRFATAVASGHATLATKQDATLYLGRTRTGWIAPALRLAHLLNHLVGGEQQVWRNGQAQRVGGFQVDDEFIFGWLLIGQIAGLLATQNAIDVCGGTAVQLNAIGSVTDQPSACYENTFGIDRRQALLRCCCNSLLIVGGEGHVGGNKNPAVGLRPYRRYGAFDIGKPATSPAFPCALTRGDRNNAMVRFRLAPVLQQLLTSAALSRRDRSGCRSLPRVARRSVAPCRHETDRGC